MVKCNENHMHVVQTIHYEKLCLPSRKVICKIVFNHNDDNQYVIIFDFNSSNQYIIMIDYNSDN